MATVTWTGLEELLAAMQALPADLVDDATAIISGAADNALAEMDATYPTRSGNLRKGLKKEDKYIGRFGVAYVVRNSAKHAWIFENGTAARHTFAGAYRGIMPPGHVFVPIAERHRARMYGELRDMLVAHGLVVTGG